VIAALYADRWWRWADGPCEVGSEEIGEAP
jgi:hypothetical protein